MPANAPNVDEHKYNADTGSMEALWVILISVGLVLLVSIIAISVCLSKRARDDKVTENTAKDPTINGDSEDQAIPLNQ